MTNQKRERNSQHPYSDGTQGDEEYFADLVRKRRQSLSGLQVSNKVMAYLNQMREVLKIEIRQARDEGNADKLYETRVRARWVEAMIIWMNRNV